MASRITNEEIEMYNIFLDAGALLEDPMWEGMTGDWRTDREEFSKQYKKYKKLVRKMNVEKEEL